MELLDHLWKQEPGGNGLRSIRLTLRFEDGTEVTAKLWEQNPNKQSQYAARARAGERLAWIIGSDNMFYALVDEDGIHEKIKPIVEIGEGGE